MGTHGRCKSCVSVGAAAAAATAAAADAATPPPHLWRSPPPPALLGAPARRPRRHSTGGPCIPHAGAGAKLDLTPLSRHAAEDAALLATVVARLEGLSSPSPSGLPPPRLPMMRGTVSQRGWRLDDDGSSGGERGTSDGSTGSGGDCRGDADGYLRDSSGCRSGWTLSAASGAGGGAGGEGGSDGGGSWASVGSAVTAASPAPLGVVPVTAGTAGTAGGRPTLAGAVRGGPGSGVDRLPASRRFSAAPRSGVTAAAAAAELAGPTGRAGGRVGVDRRPYVAVELGATPAGGAGASAAPTAAGPSSAGAKAARQAAAFWRWGRFAPCSGHAGGGGGGGAGGGGVAGGRGGTLATRGPSWWWRASAAACADGGGGAHAATAAAATAPWSSRALAWTCVAAAALSPLLLFLV